MLDTNVLLAGLVSEFSASQKIVDALQARVAIPLLSRSVVAEYRSVLLHPEILARFPVLTQRRVAMALHRLAYVGDAYHSIRTRFTFPRDPRDAKFIELAITGHATHLVTLDPDLLSLPTERSDTGKRFRHRLSRMKVSKPGAMLNEMGV